MNTTEIPLTVPLGTEAHKVASQLAIEQSTPQNGRRVYLNILAVCAVHTYLKWLQIETDLSLGESWEFSLVSADFDTKDLVIPDVGKLECYPILPEDTSLRLYPRMNTDIIGCVAVKFDENLDKAELLGFSPRLENCKLPERISIENLQPLENLLDWIPDVFENLTASNSNISPVNLSHWLDNIFEVGWLHVEDLLSPETNNLAFATRSKYTSNNQEDSAEDGISRGKIIDLGIQLDNHPFALILTFKPVNKNEEIEIYLRVYPTGNQTYLPQNLQLTVLDETGITCIEMSAREEDNWMRLEFTGKPGERFSVKLALGNLNITENFII